MDNLSVKCVCINDKNRPPEIPESKWVKKDQEYTISYTVMCLPQRRVGVMLDEIELTEKELPYEYFLLDRFVFRTIEDVNKLFELVKACTEEDFSLEELMKQTELVEQ